MPTTSDRKMTKFICSLDVVAFVKQMSFPHQFDFFGLSFEFKLETQIHRSEWVIEWAFNIHTHYLYEFCKFSVVTRLFCLFMSYISWSVFIVGNSIPLLKWTLSIHSSLPSTCRFEVSKINSQNWCHAISYSSSFCLFLFHFHVCLVFLFGSSCCISFLFGLYSICFSGGL